MLFSTLAMNLVPTRTRGRSVRLRLILTSYVCLWSAPVRTMWGEGGSFHRCGKAITENMCRHFSAPLCIVWLGIRRWFLRMVRLYLECSVLDGRAPCKEMDQLGLLADLIRTMREGLRMSWMAPKPVLGSLFGLSQTTFRNVPSRLFQSCGFVPSRLFQSKIQANDLPGTCSR